MDMKYYQEQKLKKRLNKTRMSMMKPKAIGQLPSDVDILNRSDSK